MTDGVVPVTGATGTVGRPPVAALLAAGQQVRAGVRDPARAALPDGVEVVGLDFSDPATAGAALVGVDRVFLLRPPAICSWGGRCRRQRAERAAGRSEW